MTMHLRMQKSKRNWKPTQEKNRAKCNYRQERTSQGGSARYCCYHCYTKRCKRRFRADALEIYYEKQLTDIQLNPLVNKFLRLVLEDENIFKVRKELLKDRILFSLKLKRKQRPYLKLGSDSLRIKLTMLIL